MEATVSADLDALLICLYVLVDDLLPARRRFGRPPRISDSELICLAIAQVLLDCPNERRFLRFAKRRLGHLFPYIPGQSGFNKRLPWRRSCCRRSRCSRLSPSFCDRLRLLDSTPVPCAASRETVKRSQLAGLASYGYCRSHPATSGVFASTCSAPRTDADRLRARRRERARAARRGRAARAHARARP